MFEKLPPDPLKIKMIAANTNTEAKEKIKHEISPVLEKISTEQKKKQVEQAGHTTVVREIARNLRRIKKNLDLIIGLLAITFAVITGILLGYEKYHITIIPAMVTMIFAIIAYMLPPGDLKDTMKDAVDNFQDTIQKK